MRAIIQGSNLHALVERLLDEGLRPAAVGLGPTGVELVAYETGRTDFTQLVEASGLDLYLEVNDD